MRKNGGKVFFENVGKCWEWWAVRQIEFRIEGKDQSKQEYNIILGI